MEHLHFAGYSHSDQIEIYVHPDHRVEVYCWNDGYPNPMGAGGYSRDMPKELAQNYNQEEFIRWLKDNFWCGITIEIYCSVEESVVKEFLENAFLKKESQNANCKEDPSQEQEDPSKQALHRNDPDGLQRTNPSPHKNSKFGANLG